MSWAIILPSAGQWLIVQKQTESWGLALLGYMGLMVLEHFGLILLFSCFPFVVCVVLGLKWFLQAHIAVIVY
jgi:hypothetical protein